MGTAAGGWGNGDTRGIAGVVGPTGNGVVSCNVFGEYPWAYDSDIVKCLVHAVQRSAHWVVNLSLGVRHFHTLVTASNGAVVWSFIWDLQSSCMTKNGLAPNSSVRAMQADCICQELFD
jgi:hypothetical protein